MNRVDLVAKMINATITGENFVDRSLDEYIYASLSQPPIKIIDKNNSDDELDYTVECPNCHRHVNYGNNIYMLSGHIYCDGDGCEQKLRHTIGK